MNNHFLLLCAIPILFLFFTMCFSDSAFGLSAYSLKKQLERGIEPENIVCKIDYVLVILQSDKPACLTHSTLLKLEARGYIKSIIQEFTQDRIEKDTNISNIGSSLTITGETGKTSIPQITNIPASGGAVVNFYITDNDLNTSPSGIDIIATDGLLEFLINGVEIDPPDTIIETGPNTGQFYAKLQLPNMINGRSINQDDIIEVRYLDESDAGGEKRLNTKSMPLSQTYAQVQTSTGGKTRIGHAFTVRIYEPDANLDSQDVDRISLNLIEYRGEGGIRTTLANPVFDANSSYLLETGENTGIFEVIVKIPRTIDGDTVHIGDWYDLRYVDTSTPSNTSEEIKFRGKIG